MSKTIRTKKIKLSDLRKGDKIKSYGPSTHNIVFSEVIDIWDTFVPKEDQVSLTFSDSSVLHCSTLHPIMVNQSGSTIQKLPEELTNQDEIFATN